MNGREQETYGPPAWLALSMIVLFFIAVAVLGKMIGGMVGWL